MLRAVLSMDTTIMNRLDAEWTRLYAEPALAGHVRAMVLELKKPADWPVFARLWQGVQVNEGWPAPAIAVNGRDGYQMWLSLQTAVPLVQAQRAVSRLCQCYWPDVDPQRIGWWPQGEGHELPSRPVHEVSPDAWAAFVAPDLAPIFAETPWLDLPPSPDAQADLLLRCRSVDTRDFLSWLAPEAAEVSAPPQSAPPPSSATPPVSAADPFHDAARRFLHDAMHNEQVDWPWRIEAAKALLGQRGR